MNRTLHALAALALFGSPALAQSDTTATIRVAQAGSTAAAKTDTIPGASQDERAAKAAKQALLVPAIQIDRIRPNDQRGLNQFETPKASTVPFTGFKLNFGAAFTQQFQGLSHENTAAAKPATTAAGQPYNANQLMTIGHGFNNAVANLYVNAQLAKGVRVALTSYLSARHHQETWVKDGYFLIDDSPIDHPLLNRVMQYTTLRVGHFELNYGDAHFRRTDNGQAMFNPLVGNYIMDAFTTEIGAEAYLRARGTFVMGGVANGESRGMVIRPAQRAPAFFGKVGTDQQLTPALRVRLTGSLYSQARATNQTLYSGDRAGSRYYLVLENVQATETAQAWSGAIQTGFTSEMHAAVVNPFLKYRGLELFGNLERARGRAATEATTRQWTQQVGEATYRFLDDQLYVAGRYNTATGRLAGFTADATVRRTQVGGGWFVTPLVLAKVEYVTQKYLDFPVSDIRNGGQFKGLMIEGTVAF